jgi:L,D-peptidoglycan transpeptidase YkuD (ErfK/YbiS/YcfS/YnhG family)
MRCRWVLLGLAGLLSGCSRERSGDAPVKGLPAGAKQVVVVRRDGVEPFAARLSGYELGEGGWRQAFRTVPAVIGRNGFAAPGEKREGDGKTPSGIYRLIQGFAYPGQVDTFMPMKVSTADSYWVDDPESPDYNRWVYGKPKARSYERMRRDDDLYKVGLVIEYNTDPVVKGHGSAIFLHVWHGPHSPTAGCVALAEADLRGALSWLVPDKAPVIALNPPGGE